MKEIAMEKAAKGVTPEIITEEIVATTEEIVAEAKEEAIEAPSKFCAKLRELEAMWERTGAQFFQAPKL
jgi:hypothetical protein